MADLVFTPGGAKPLGLERQAFMRVFPCPDAADASAVWPLGPRFWAQVRTFPWEFTPGTFVGSASALGSLVLSLDGAGAVAPECLVQHSSGVVIIGGAADGVAAAAGQSVACFKGATTADRFMVVFPASSVRVDASGRFATGVVGGADPARLPLLVAMWMSGIRHVGAPDAATATTTAAAPTTVEAELSAAGLLPRLPVLMGELAALLRHVRHRCPSPSLHVCARADATSSSSALTLTSAPLSASGAAKCIIRHDVVTGMLSVPPPPAAAASSMHAGATGAASGGAVAGVKRPRPADSAAATGGAGVDGSSGSGEPASKRPALDGGVTGVAAAIALPQPRLPFVECGRDFARVRSMLAASRARGAAAAPPAAADQPVSLAIIVPFRDQPEQNRMEQLHRFAAAMPAFLARCRSRSGAPLARYHVFIVEQSNDGFKFNRGKLLNAGYTMVKDDALMAALGILPPPGAAASSTGAATAASAGAASSAAASTGVAACGFNSFCFHDVDLLPGGELGPLYAAYPSKPIHIGYAWTRYLLPGYQYVGGILTLGRHTMEACNG